MGRLIQYHYTIRFISNFLSVNGKLSQSEVLLKISRNTMMKTEYIVGTIQSLVNLSSLRSQWIIHSPVNGLTQPGAAALWRQIQLLAALILFYLNICRIMYMMIAYHVVLLLPASVAMQATVVEAAMSALMRLTITMRITMLRAVIFRKLVQVIQMEPHGGQTDALVEDE